MAIRKQKAKQPVNGVTKPVVNVPSQQDATVPAALDAQFANPPAMQEFYDLHKDELKDSPYLDADGEPFNDAYDEDGNPLED